MPSLIGAAIKESKDNDPVLSHMVAGTLVDSTGAAQPLAPTSKPMESETIVPQPSSSSKTVDIASGDTAKQEEDPSEYSSSTDTSTPKSKKRRVTPGEDSDSKQSQQKKVNQMSLSSFFLPAEKECDEKSPMASSCDKKHGGAGANKKRKATSAAANGSSVLENLPSPRKRALEEAMAKAESVEDKKVAAKPRADGTKKEPESAPATGNEPELKDSDLKAESENSTSRPRR
ncbi:MAG: hypothetical protein SGARI_006113 [Bacillariaceae sp.]